jgi:uncharacterized protein with ATP-grasp and redox domains
MNETKVPPSLVKYCFEDDDVIDNIKTMAKDLATVIQHRIEQVERRSNEALRLARVWCIIAGEAKGWTESEIEEQLKDIIGK